MPIVQTVLSELVHQKRAVEKEGYQSRIVPRYDDSPEYNEEKFGCAKDMGEEIDWTKRLSENYLDIQFENSEVTNSPLRYFTLKIYMYNRDFIFKKDFPLTELAFFINLVIGILVKKGKLEAKEEFSCEIIARDNDEPRVDPNLYKSSRYPIPIPVSIPSGDGKLLLDRESIVGYDEDDSLSDLISLESGEDQVGFEIKEKQISSYTIQKEIGKVESDDLKIFINRKAIDRLSEITRPSVTLGKELIGILVGDVYQDTETKKMFIEICDIIPAEEAPSDFGYAILDNRTLNIINDRMSKEYPGKCNLGWYHTHLIKMIRFSHDKDALKGHAMAQMFFSRDDNFLHQHFFTKPWHIAIVVDPADQEMVIFQWKNDKIETCGGYYIFINEKED